MLAAVARWIASSDRRSPADLRGSRRYRLDRKQSQPGEYPDRDGRSLSAEAPCGSGDLDRGEQA